MPRKLLLWCSLSAALIVGCLTQSARADVSFQWQNNNISEKEALLASYLADSNVITDFVRVISENFNTEDPLSIVIGSSEGPSYDHEQHAIKLPFSYLENAIKSQVELLDEGDNALNRAIDVVEYTLYHLLGHALVRDSSVDSDEIAQRLSTWIMLTHWPNGAEQWYQDVRVFAEASQKLDGGLEDFWHKHAINASRQREIECWILGYSPDQIEPLLPAVLDSAQRRTECVRAWQELQDHALTILTPLLQSEAKLMPR
ncbi:MAG: DUF4344 domain-containing metallopeptidase [Gammaproteobacteria bacterium]|nr:DUF4344 domain-containing metallopeptidase [Gammaproteobacteria bacterium]